MPFSFGVIGSGWRAEFFLRIARDLPEQFPLAGVVGRNPDKRAELARRWSAPTFSTLDELLAEKRPDFVVTSVSASANLEWMEVLSERGVPILSETPIGRDLKELHRVVDLVRTGARIQVAEQYIFQPLHAARLALIESGQLGTIHEVDVSIAHGYHGVSLLRHFLQTGLRLPKIAARRFTSRIVAGPHRNRLPTERKMAESVRTIAQLDYGDRLGTFDFTGDQYHSWIRSPRLMVRGEEGEINQNTVRLLKRFDTPFQLISSGAIPGMRAIWRVIRIGASRAEERFCTRIRSRTCVGMTMRSRLQLHSCGWPPTWRQANPRTASRKLVMTATSTS